MYLYMQVSSRSTPAGKDFWNCFRSDGAWHFFEPVGWSLQRSVRNRSFSGAVAEPSCERASLVWPVVYDTAYFAGTDMMEGPAKLTRRFRQDHRLALPSCGGILKRFDYPPLIPNDFRWVERAAGPLLLCPVYDRYQPQSSWWAAPNLRVSAGFKKPSLGRLLRSGDRDKTEPRNFRKRSACR